MVTCCSAGLALAVGVRGQETAAWGGEGDFRASAWTGEECEERAQRAEGDHPSSGEGDVLGMLMGAGHLVMSDTQMAIQNARSWKQWLGF